ncbi:hypothetical protein ABEB36_009735 [Hypothenemus hampei]|uniref:Uncharacterized protein n=1 Tax=Hypothenemus hampei TaxID=57062 RepID=A0ABD1EHI5_HYPHA
MAFWKSDCESTELVPILNNVEQFSDNVNSPILSNNSIENSSDSLASDQTDPSKGESPSKAVQLAKKRLLSYAAQKLKTNVKEEKKIENFNSSDKEPKPLLKKTKQVYPEESAKAVIRDIEFLKKTGYGYQGIKGPSPGLLPDIVIPDVKPLCLSTEEGRIFKKRYIKCKNIRKNNPGIVNARLKSNTSPKIKSNSQENYKEVKPKVEHHNSSIKKSDNGKFDFKKYFNFTAPSVLIEMFKSKSINGEITKIPFQHLRCTTTKPSILFSENRQMPSGFLTRKQFFTLIPNERRILIEKLALDTSEKYDSETKMIKTRKWFPKNWRKFENSEGKLLENSVGLSFLQSYSDEDEDDKKQNEPINEEIVKVESKSSLTPSCSPKMCQEQGELIESASKSKWDDSCEVDNLTPPTENMQNEHFVEEYKKTKEELEKLKAALNLPDFCIEKFRDVFQKDDEDEESLKSSSSKSNKKKLKRKLRHKQIKYSNSELQEERTKKKKKKKSSGKNKSTKEKKRKKEEIKLTIDSIEEQPNKPPKVKIYNEEMNMEKKMFESDDYEDDMKFFAKRFNEEQEKTPIRQNLTKENEESPKIKIDLLKMNEDYLKKQKKKEKLLLSLKEQEPNKNENNDESSITPINEEPNWEKLRDKRKRICEVKSETNNDTALMSMQKSITAFNSWESDEEPVVENCTNYSTTTDSVRLNLPLDIPFNIQPFIKREIKLENLQKPIEIPVTTRIIHDPDFFDIETVQTPPPEEKHRSTNAEGTPDKVVTNLNNSSVILENEYEEFMKSVTFTETTVNANTTSKLESHEETRKQELDTISLVVPQSEPVQTSEALKPIDEISLTPDKKVIFTTLTLPSKKLLIDNSKLNLNDSTDENEDDSLDETEKKKIKDAVTKEEEIIEDENKQVVLPSPTKHHYKSPSPRRNRKEKSPKRRTREDKRISPSRRRSSPKRRRRSVSPLRRSRASPRRRRSPRYRSPLRRRNSVSPKRRSSTMASRRDLSPLKKSLADSTISDDQLENQRTSEITSPKRIPLDVRINQVLGLEERKSEQSPEPSTYYSDPNWNCHYTNNVPQTTYRQVGNMVQIVPTDNVPDLTPVDYHQHQPYEMINQQVDLRPKIVQVGNMLQIVPTDSIPADFVPEVKPNDNKTDWYETSPTCYQQSEKSSAEAAMLLKTAERRAERELRRQEREKRRKEKERRRKEKEIAKMAKLKAKTEIMIKRALELEVDEDEEEERAPIASNNEVVIEQANASQWPPASIALHSKEAGKSILLNSKAGDEPLNSEKRKSKTVQFADGIRPGEGTSPSAGEELSSPPPPKKKMTKEKRLKKLKFDKQMSKRKVKVKVIKKPSTQFDSDSEDNLPPPSPPPGSPPPHLFPPRIKVNSVNNVPATYLTSIIQNAQQQVDHDSNFFMQNNDFSFIKQQQTQPPGMFQPNLYRNLMAPPPPPSQGHLQASPHSSILTSTVSPQSPYHPPTTHLTGHGRHF